MGHRIAIVLLLLVVLVAAALAQIEPGDPQAGGSEVKPPIHWAAATFVSATDLRLPLNAAKEFKKANQLIAEQNWKKAIDRLHRGLAIYPQYAAGYNNLGAIYSQLGSNAPAREALEKAIALDDRFAPAYVNLGRLSFLEKNFPAAESLLRRALSLAPAANADELFLLADSQLKDGNLDQAMATTRMAHITKVDGHAILHLIAANAFERQKKIADSIAELQAYLSEEGSSAHPDKARCERARYALAGLQAQEDERLARNNANR